MLRSSILYLVVFLLNGHLANSQTVTWEKLFAKKSTDAFRSATEVPGGGYVSAGYTADFTNNDTDAYVVRTAANGDTIWTSSINGPLSRKDLFYKVINADNGFVCCGYTTSFNNNSDEAYFVKLDLNGNILWQNTFGGVGRDRAQEIGQTADGGYIVSGYVAPNGNYSGFLLKLNANGDTTWSRLFRFPGSTYCDFNSVKQLADGGFIACGQVNIGGNNDVYIVRTDPNGNLIWQRAAGTNSGGSDNGECIIITSNGYAIAGGTDNNGYFLKVDTSGFKQWEKIFGGNPLNDDFHQVSTTFDGGYVLAGTTSSSGPIDPNIWLFKTNANGDSLWSRTFGGDNHDHGYSGVQTADSGYIVSGYSSSFGFNYENAYLIKTDANGNLYNYLTYSKIDSVLTPVTGGCSDDSARIVVVVRNFGRDTLSNVPISAVLSGAVNQTLTDIFAGPLYPGDILRDTMPVFVDLRSQNCSLSVNAFTTNPNDVIPNDNGTIINVTLIQPPTVTEASVCNAGIVTLNATGCETVYWYDAPTGNNLLLSGNSFVTPYLTSSAIYYAQTGINCPDNRVPVNATVNPNPSFALGGGADTLIGVAPYLLNAPSGYVSYVWSNSANTPSINVLSSGLYCVTVRDNNNCFGDDCIYVDIANGTSDLESTMGVTLFPNPVHHQLMIHSNQQQQDLSATVFDVTGKSVYSESWPFVDAGSTLFINLLSLSPGMYTISLQSSTNVGSLRIVKE